MPIRRLSIVLALMAHVAGCSDDDGETSATEDAGVTIDAGPPLNFEAFDRALEAAIAAHNQTSPEPTYIHGASAVVVDRTRGIVHSKGYGEFAADRLYLVASAGKIISSGVVMRLSDRGSLALDEPISRYLQDWGAHKQNVTTRQLLSNSSGLPALIEVSVALFTSDEAERMRFAPHYCQYRLANSLADCGKSIYQDDFAGNNRMPDQVFRYGGSQWQLAGALAEHVSGKQWNDLVDETYGPCGVTTAGYTNQFEVAPLTYPADFNGDVTKLPVTANPSIEGGAYITAPDYGKILWMHLRSGLCGTTRVLSADAVATMQRDRVGGTMGYAPTVGTGNNYTGEPYDYRGYGLGWWVDDTRGFVADPGAYGAYPILDVTRGYAAFIAIEETEDIGSTLMAAVQPVLNTIFATASP